MSFATKRVAGVWYRESIEGFFNKRYLSSFKKYLSLINIFFEKDGISLKKHEKSSEPVKQVWASIIPREAFLFSFGQFYEAL